jgi:hypothetical protein
MAEIDRLLRNLVHGRRPRACFRYREREPGRLQLRVILRPDENVCDVLVKEDDVAVEVLILICGDIKDPGEAMDCPVHVYLSRELGHRPVFDAARGGTKVEHYTPNW